MLANLADYRREKTQGEIAFYLTSTGKDIEYLFVLAYQCYFAQVDVYEIRANLDRYRLTKDAPPYVRAFLGRRLQ